MSRRVVGIRGIGCPDHRGDPRSGGNPSESMWNGIWVPGFASEYDLLDWENQRGEVDDNLIEIMHEAERLTGVDVGRADAFRGVMWDTWTAFMNDYDVLVSPTLASATFPLSQFAPSWLEGASLREQLLDWLFTYPYNMLNNPAITVPAGFTADGRPVGGCRSPHVTARTQCPAGCRELRSGTSVGGQEAGRFTGRGLAHTIG